MSERNYDIVLFGASGFTGGMTADYLAKHAPDGLRWAIAGRDLDKLQTIKRRLCEIEPRCDRVGVVTANVDDPPSLQQMAEQTRLLLTTVGPFLDYGEPVVRACVAAGTDYVDSTGEPAFVQRLLERYDAEAKQRGIRLVSSCGFDAIPADFGAYFTVKQLPADQPIAMAGYLSMNAKFSGGTERSALRAFEPLPDEQAYGEGRSGRRRARAAHARIHFCEELGSWATPFPTIDASIVRRSATGLTAYGPDFSYTHHAEHPTRVAMWAALLVFGSLAAMARVKVLRELMLLGAKKSGEGPSAEEMDRAWFKLRFIAHCAGRVWVTEVAGGDPGYRETSKMLAESAMCLVLDEGLPMNRGVLTPVEAMGYTLLDRLRRAGLRFSVLSAGVNARE